MRDATLAPFFGGIWARDIGVTMFYYKCSGCDRVVEYRRERERDLSSTWICKYPLPDRDQRKWVHYLTRVVPQCTAYVIVGDRCVNVVRYDWAFSDNPCS